MARASRHYIPGHIWHTHPALEVARELNVSSQNILRALEKGPTLLKDLGWGEE
jgi:hypothetical protein